MKNIIFISLLVIVLNSCQQNANVMNSIDDNNRIFEKDTLSKFLKKEGFIENNDPPTLFSIDSLMDEKNEIQTTFISKDLKKWLDKKTKDILYPYEYCKKENLYFLILKSYSNDEYSLIDDYRIYIYNKKINKFTMSAFILTEWDEIHGNSKTFTFRSGINMYRYHFKIKDFNNTNLPKWIYFQYYSELFKLNEFGYITLIQKTKLFEDTLYNDNDIFNCNLLFNEIKNNPKISKNVIQPFYLRQ